ncbi:hypothetical protein SAMN05444007_1161 [Cribrihabitans marinus]|uniref:Sulfotransferase family protein n=1 Tax=Cribrihabitans marinus TaxID=1227549 RepID=A0A1H7E3V7_9RHOB|nr:hypothetical protein [Cribrihabitans marinus]GGH40918.1 hypothetical protein GCM10010973_37540 [Cribrihabitans marinus]SEK06290.1 hypothetical protein SAMN05444007_1161 [Cribrihabitans marinus]
MRKAFVHIGMPKTGTTAIQEALSKAREPLRSAGFLYPGNDVDHAFLISTYHPVGGRHFYFAKQGISPEAANRSFEKKISRLAREVGESAGDVLLSTEYLHNMGEAKLRELQANLSKLELEMHVVCYVRHPYSQAASSIQQNIKMGHGVLTQQLNNPNWHSIIDTLNPALNVLGRERVTVLSFEDAKDVGAERHILQAIGHGSLMELVDRAETNVSLSGAAVALADAHNRLQRIVPDFPSSRGYLFKIGGPRFSLPPRTIEKMRDRTQQELDWLEEHFSLALPEPESRPFQIQRLSEEAAEDIVKIIMQSSRRNQ